MANDLVAVTPIAPPATAMVSAGQLAERVTRLDEIFRGVMQEGVDYGVIPGTQRPTLLKPGAEMLGIVFGLSARFEVMPESIQDWAGGFFHFVVKCTLVDGNGQLRGEGYGECNTREARYRWRNSVPSCPSCGHEVRRSRQEPGWYCWTKQGGCGATFPPDAIAPGGRIENSEPYDLVNTCLKMGQKRAHVCAVLSTTGASRIFTQDVEDMPAELLGGASVSEAPRQQREQDPPSGAPNARPVQTQNQRPPQPGARRTINPWVGKHDEVKHSPQRRAKALGELSKLITAIKRAGVDVPNAPASISSLPDGAIEAAIGILRANARVPSSPAYERDGAGQFPGAPGPGYSDNPADEDDVYEAAGMTPEDVYDAHAEIQDAGSR